MSGFVKEGKGQQLYYRMGQFSSVQLSPDTFSVRMSLLIASICLVSSARRRCVLFIVGSLCPSMPNQNVDFELLCQSHLTAESYLYVHSCHASSLVCLQGSP